MEAFDVRSRAEGEWAILDVQGDVDVYTASQLRQLIFDEVDHGARKIVVNLKNVPFVDSTGLAAMIGGARRARERHGDLVLASPSPHVRSTLRVTDLDKMFPTFGTVAEALQVGRNAGGETNGR